MFFRKVGMYKTLCREKGGSECFSFKGKRIFCKCVDVYDGDTITVKFFYNSELYTYKIRMCGLDTPELRTKNEEEKNTSKNIKQIVENMLLNKIIKLDCREFDKYGRILANVYVKMDKGEVCVNEFLIDNKLAVHYEGNTKQEFKLENYNTNVKEIKTTDYGMWDFLKN